MTSWQLSWPGMCGWQTTLLAIPPQSALVERLMPFLLQLELLVLSKEAR